MRTILSAALAGIAICSIHPLGGAEPLPSLRVGFAERDITPEIGMEQPGGYGKAFHRQIHDPCKVRAVVFDDGKTRVALVGVDALIVRRQLVEPVRKEIQREVRHRARGDPDRRLALALLRPDRHGPARRVRPRLAAGQDAGLREVVLRRRQVPADRSTSSIVEAVCEADARRAEARCGVGAGIEDKVAFNRRFRMKNGLSYTHPGKGNPDIVEPAGPIDPQVGVIGVWDRQGKLLGCVVNFACHATTRAPGGISANWIYYMEQTIRGAFGPDVVVVFLQGACGDVTQVDNLSPTARSPSVGRLVGGRVGAEAVKVLLSMAPRHARPAGLPR